MREALQHLDARPGPVFEQGLWLRILARLTTEPWSRGGPAHPALVEALDGVAERGGMLRQALARNFVLWRPYVRAGETRCVIVLPAPGIGLSDRELLAVALDLLCASGAVAAPGQLVAGPGGAAALDLALRAAERTIQDALARGGMPE